MAIKKIIAVGLDIPESGSDIVATDLREKVSLLDYDIIIIDPSIYCFFGYKYEEYQGKPCLDDSNSFKLKEQLGYWRREILESIKAGKNIYLMLNEEQVVYVVTGEKSFSGTGRNRNTTRYVTPISNYQLVPADISATNTNGSSMALVGKDNVLAPYWSVLQDVSTFRVMLDGKRLVTLVQTKAGGKTVGARIRCKNADGNLVLLPYIDFHLEEYVSQNEEDMETHWTEEAIQLGKRFLAAIYELNRSLISTSELSAQPDWVTQNKYQLKKEEKARGKLLVVETKISKLHEEKELIKQHIEEESILKRLLYEKGKPLEVAIRIALELMGFSVSHFNDSYSEFDVVFESEEGRVIGEVEGKDNKAVNVDKIRQLLSNIDEDFAREEVVIIAKAALIGNAYRLVNPEEREEFFTAKCLKMATIRHVALIRTVDLFYVSQYLAGRSDNTFAQKCRKEILNTTGIVKFPSISKTEKVNKTVVDNTKKYNSCVKAVV